MLLTPVRFSPLIFFPSHALDVKKLVLRGFVSASRLNSRFPTSTQAQQTGATPHASTCVCAHESSMTQKTGRISARPDKGCFGSRNLIHGLSSAIVVHFLSVILATDPQRLLPARAVFVIGFADATGVQTDLIEVLVRQKAARVLIDFPPDPADPQQLDPGGARPYRRDQGRRRGPGLGRHRRCDVVPRRRRRSRSDGQLDRCGRLCAGCDVKPR